jgi:hypothetical protein
MLPCQQLLGCVSMRQIFLHVSTSTSSSCHHQSMSAHGASHALSFGCIYQQTAGTAGCCTAVCTSALPTETTNASVTCNLGDTVTWPAGSIIRLTVPTFATMDFKGGVNRATVADDRNRTAQATAPVAADIVAPVSCLLQLCCIVLHLSSNPHMSS